MTHPFRRAALSLGALATLAAAGCGGAPTASEPAVAASGPASLFITSGTTTPAPEDSVMGGYGSGSTGGIEYENFEYDPVSGTETVTTDDPAASSGGMTYQSTSGSDFTVVTPQDSVYSGYGSGSTGGIEYESFEYEPETGTEYEATSDTTASQPKPTPTP